MVISASRILVLIAAALFLLAAFGVGLPVAVVPLGLAFLAASFLVA